MSLPFALDHALQPSVSEDYSLVGNKVKRVVRVAGRARSRSKIAPQGLGVEAAALFEVGRLREQRRPLESRGEVFHVVDAFSGCGGLSLGVHEAAGALGKSPRSVLAIDASEPAVSVFSQNFSPVRMLSDPIEEHVPGDLGGTLHRSERRLRSVTGQVDLLVGGPPCQGHSDLNNHSRRNDPKNHLYARMARLAEVLRPSAILIENVPGVVHDRQRVVQTTQSFLRDLGYGVEQVSLRSDEFGAAQRRRRHFTVALRGMTLSKFGANLAMLRQPSVSVLNALADLVNLVPEPGATFDTPAKHSSVNEARIEYLFRHDLYELPDDQRPDCHRLKPHSYQSVYGRLFPNEPAPTITSGFGSTGQGRFVHPLLPRTITPHEAARLQGFPDWFSFDSVTKRGALQEMIGNAVPFRLAFSVSLALLGAMK